MIWIASRAVFARSMAIIVSVVMSIFGAVVLFSICSRQPMVDSPSATWLSFM